MEQHVRPWRIAAAAASVSLLLALPALAAASHLTSGPLGTTLFNRVIQRLCEIQQALGNRVILADPARCAPPPLPAPTLTLSKTVINDNGGTATTTDFQAKIDDVSVPWDIAQTVSVGTHTASETTLSGYGASSWGSDCAADGTVTLAAGENKTCTITNDDQSGHLIVDKVTVPAGSAAVFSVTATGTGVIMGGGAGTTTDATNKEYSVSVGTYSVSEAALAGWIEVSNTCVNVAVGVGETKTCTITNHRLPKLTVTKIVINDGGGTATTTDFTLMIDGATTTSGVQNIVATGTRVVSEGAHAGYTATIGGDCNADGSILLAIGDIKTCSIMNDDNPPEITGKLLITEVLYDLSNAEGDPQGVESANEWVEIRNGTDSVQNLSGFTIHDEAGSDLIPEGTILTPGQFLIVTSSTTTESFYDIPEEAIVVVLSSSIGSNGLANAGDMVELRGALDVSIDAVSWGDNVTAFDPSVFPTTSDDNPGSSITRTSPTTDTNTAADWVENTTPTPGS
ncbi:lamin tail domain-containing protein [Candidatus Kaiserbacteria bacterium]|nr:lamin tail domain-containing protein [Candidatus Kaiserbacteria bacterium]